MPAFEPRQVVWKNLAIPFYERMIRQIVVKVIVFLTVVFYMIPITFISAFTTVNKLKKLFPFLKSIVGKKAIEGIVEAYFPQLALILFLYFLPTILLMLSKAEGNNTFKKPCSESFIWKVFLIYSVQRLLGSYNRWHLVRDPQAGWKATQLNCDTAWQFSSFSPGI